MVKTVSRLIEQNKILELSEYFSNLNSVDIAKDMMDLRDEKIVLAFRILPKDTAVEVFSYLESDMREYIIQSITDSELKDIVDKLFLDDTVDIIEELPSNIVKKVLKNTSKEKRELINQLLKYDENTAGSIMTIEFLDLRESMTVKHAIEYLRKDALHKEDVDTCFIIDNNRKLKGTIRLKELILNNENILIEDIMDRNVVFTSTMKDQEIVASEFKKYDLTCMPVVDKEDRLVGIITVDDIMDIVDKENTEDFHKMAAIKPNEESYLKIPVINLAKDRITWLLVLMVSATLTGSIIKKFDDVLQSVVILASFIPMLMDTGGNAGSQSSTVVIRGLVLGDIELKDYLKVMFKEFRVGLITAFILAIVNFLRVYLFERTSVLISLTVSLSLFCTVVIAKVVGGSLPIIAKKLKFDPAIMASPLITTIVDTFSLMVYFTFAKLLLGI